MGSYKKYRTATALSKAVDKYFRSICRTRPAEEMVPTGQYTQKGMPIYEPKEILNDDGEPIMVKEYIVPPSILALCKFLGISKDTWASYSRDEKLSGVCAEAKMMVEIYLNEQLTTRLKGVDGIKFNLENNFDWKQKHELSGKGTVEDFLRQHPGENKDEF